MRCNGRLAEMRLSWYHGGAFYKWSALYSRCPRFRLTYEKSVAEQRKCEPCQGPAPPLLLIVLLILRIKFGLMANDRWCILYVALR
jgi:hypothetical protein